MSFVNEGNVVHFVTKEAIIEAGESDSVIAICGAEWIKNSVSESSVKCEECEELQYDY